MAAIPPTADLEQAAARLVLAEGIAALTFGRLSRVTGVSDRMLVYRFGTKAALLERALHHVAAGLREELSGALAPGPTDPGSLVRLAAEALREPASAPVVATWLEVLAGATRGDPACAAAAERVARGWHTWLTDVLSAEPDPARAAGDVLVRLEGAVVLHAAGLTAEAEAATG